MSTTSITRDTQHVTDQPVTTKPPRSDALGGAVREVQKEHQEQRKREQRNNTEKLARRRAVQPYD